MDGAEGIPDSLKCKICSQVCKRGVKVPCCNTRACRGCATKYLTRNKICWDNTCGVKTKTLDLINDEDLRDDVEKFLKKVKSEEATPKSNVEEDARNDQMDNIPAGNVDTGGDSDGGDLKKVKSDEATPKSNVKEELFEKEETLQEANDDQMDYVPSGDSDGDDLKGDSDGGDLKKVKSDEATPKSNVKEELFEDEETLEDDRDDQLDNVTAGDVGEVNKHEDEVVGIQESIVAVTKLPESEDVEEKMSEDQAIPEEAKNDKVVSVSSGLKSSSGESSEHEAVDVGKLENIVALAPLPESEEFVLEDMNIETADDMIDSLDTVSMNMGVSLAKMKERNCEFERCMSPDEKACNELRFGAQLELLLKFTADHARCLMCGKLLASEFLILKHIQLKHKVEYGQLRTVLQITNMNTLNMLVHKAIRAEFSYQQKQIFPIPVV